MTTQITPTSELQAVNIMLSTIGEAPVNSITGTTTVDVSTAKNILNLGLKVIIENNYASHIGITAKEYESLGVKIKNSSKEVLNNCN